MSRRPVAQSAPTPVYNPPPCPTQWVARVVSIACLWTLPAGAATLRVPGDYPTLPAAVHAAAGGDTVLVGPGLYAVNLNIDQALALVSTGGPEDTILDGGFLGRILTVGTTRVVPWFHLEGFTLRRGESGAVALAASRYTIATNVFENNEHEDGAACVSAVFGAGTINNNVMVRNNQRGSTGEATLVQADVISFQRNVIRENGVFDHRLVWLNGTPGAIIAYNQFTDNVLPLSVATFAANGHIHHNTFANNTWTTIDFVTHSSANTLVFENNLIAEPLEIALDCDLAPGSILEARCNAFYEPHGNRAFGDCDGVFQSGTTFGVDPKFCDQASGDYHLTSESPYALSNTTPGCGLIGALGAVCSTTGSEPPPSPPLPTMVSIQPNPVPFGHTVHFEIFTTVDEPRRYTVEVYDAAGRRLRQLHAHRTAFTWLPTGLNSGLYFLRVSDGTRTEVSKLVLFR